jgi:hypothetical protein
MLGPAIDVLGVLTLPVDERITMETRVAQDAHGLGRPVRSLAPTLPRVVERARHRDITLRYLGQASPASSASSESQRHDFPELRPSKGICICTISVEPQEAARLKAHDADDACDAHK